MPVSPHPNSSRLLHSSWNTIRELDVAVRCPIKYGCRGGHQHGIPTLIGHRPASTYVRMLSSQHDDNLIPFTLISNLQICPTTTGSLCVLNARSVCNKIANMLCHIHEYDFVAISEVWLTNKDSDLPVTRAMTPPG